MTIVMVCNAARPPEYKRASANIASKAPQKALCQRGKRLLPWEARLLMTKIPESADVTKNMKIASMAANDVREGNGKTEGKRRASLLYC